MAVSRFKPKEQSCGDHEQHPEDGVAGPCGHRTAPTNRALLFSALDSQRLTRLFFTYLPDEPIEIVMKHCRRGHERDGNANQGFIFKQTPGMCQRSESEAEPNVRNNKNGTRTK